MIIEINQAGVHQKEARFYRLAPEKISAPQEAVGDLSEDKAATTDDDLMPDLVGFEVATLQTALLDNPLDVGSVLGQQDYLLYTVEQLVAGGLGHFSHHACLLLTADSRIEEVCLPISEHQLAAVLIYVADFKDGRVFSLVRQLRLEGFVQDIWIAGKFGVDQAAYFYKSGASGFVVGEDRRAIVLKTLQDLRSAHAGRKSSNLPLFLS